MVQCGIEGQTAAHRVAQPVSGPGGAALENLYQVSGDAKYRVASGIDRGVAAAVTGQVDGEHAEARRQLRPQVAPRGPAAGEAVEQQQRLARPGLLNGIAQAVDSLVAHAASGSSAGHAVATSRR